jgi:hypothetical protein
MYSQDAVNGRIASILLGWRRDRRRPQRRPSVTSPTATLADSPNDAAGQAGSCSNHAQADFEVEPDQLRHLSPVPQQDLDPSASSNTKLTVSA